MGPTRINTILQSAFFKLANIIPEDKAIELMKAAAKATYGRKGDDIVMKNWAAIEEGAKQVVEVQVPESWKNCEDEGLDFVHVTEGRKDVVDFVNNIQAKVNAQEGNSLPVSAFKDYVDGSTPSGSSAFEKRGIAVNVPVWNPDNCIQCNFCSYVCPHAVIRPVVMTEEEAAKSWESAVDIVAAKIPAKITPASSAAGTPYWLSRLEICTIIVSESAKCSKVPAAVMALPTTPMNTATAMEITTQVVATRREIVSFFSSSIAINRSRMCGIPK